MAVNSTWLVARGLGFFPMMVLLEGTGDVVFEVCSHVRRVDILSSGCNHVRPRMNRHYVYQEGRNGWTGNNRVSIVSKREGGGHHRARTRGVSIVAAGAVSALLLAACGGASAPQTTSQDLAAGIAAQDAGQYASAANYYEKALVNEPTNSVALYNLGDVEQLQGLDSLAKAHYLSALAINPNFVSALYNLATLDATTSPASAEALYLQVITLSPTDGAAHFNLGYVLLSLGKRAAGLSEINRGIALDPSLKSRVVASTTTTVAGG
jgi:tetratricopeptide (TPR) repeat protein